MAVGIGGAAAQPRAGFAYLATARTTPVPIIVSGVRLSTPAIMLRDVGRTVLPMRALFTSLGAQVVWNARERAVYAWKTDGTGVRFGVGEAQAQSLLMPGPNETATVTERRSLDAPPTLLNGRMYIPVRAASEMLGTDVVWDDEKRTVFVGLIDPTVEVKVVPEPTDR
ncbi:MAG: copper amine oxidase N-terminal domain-containing protein [Actinomycetota bacterium]